MNNLEGLKRLNQIAEEHPEVFNEVLKEYPDKFAAIEKLRKETEAQYSASKSIFVEGFKTFYREIYNREVPEINIPIIEAFVTAFHEQTGVIEECWRGFGKSTVLIAWASYVIGARPVGSTALVRINDTKAKEAGDTIAEIIEKNPGWKKIFPHVVPDKEAGWSVERGYHVKDMRVVDRDGYDKWLQMCFADHVSEPSLATGGVSSGIIIGMHPTNGMWFDDLHDEDNTRSVAEMQKVVDILDGNIIPTWFGVAGSPALGVACTPWNEKDAYVRMMKSGLFEKVTIPIFVRDGQIPENHPVKPLWDKNKKEHGVKYFEPYDWNVVLTWPDAFPMNRIMQMYMAGPARFGQMYLLDLTTLKGLVLLKEWLMEFPYEKINPSWPVYFGIDFASTTDKLKQGDTDYFTLAVGRALPEGGIVLIDGYRDRVPTHIALNKVQVMADRYKPLAIGVEKWGKGEEFKNQLIYSVKQRVVPLPHQGTPVRSKGQRFEIELGTSFATGRMMISDLRNDFIENFKDEWISWDGALQKSRTGHDDTLDAVYWLGEIALGSVMKKTDTTVPIPGERKNSPFATVGEFYGGRRG